MRVTRDRPSVRSGDAEFAAVNVGEKLLVVDRGVQALDWLQCPPAEGFALMRALPERKKRSLFASCIARTLKPQLAFEPSARPEVEATVARLDFDFAKVVGANLKPVWSAALVWMRIPKARILDVAPRDARRRLGRGPVEAQEGRARRGDGSRVRPPAPRRPAT